MSILQLPNDFDTDMNSDVQIFDYRITNACLKNKVMLNRHVFSFLLEGTKELITKDRSRIINNREFLLIKSGHCLMTENLSEGNIYQSILFFFTDQMLLNFLEKNKLTKILHPVEKPYQILAYDDYVHHFVSSLVKIKTYKKSFQSNLLETKFEEIMTYLLHRNGPECLVHLYAHQDNQSRHFMRVVESNKLNNLTLQELAFLCNMSISTFKRNFEQHYQTSPIKWFQEKRLEHSAYLLNVKKRRPVDIYHEAGYESLSSFTQAFKAKYHTTPKQFQVEK